MVSNPEIFAELQNSENVQNQEKVTNLRDRKFEVSEHEISQNFSNSGKILKSRKIEILSKQSD